jgi:hypothetical protein
MPEGPNGTEPSIFQNLEEALYNKGKVELAEAGD